MMSLLTAFAVLLVQPTVTIVQESAQEESASSIVSKVFAKYHDTKSASGTIKFVQKASNVSVGIDTTFQFEGTSKIYIRQDRRSSEGGVYFCVSDATTFCYPLPNDHSAIDPSKGGKLLYEAVNQNGRILSYRDIYAAASRGLPDRCIPLDIVISRREDLEFLTHQWMTLKASKRKAADDAEDTVISGDWRAEGNMPASGLFELTVDKDLNIKSYEVREYIKPDPNSPEILVVSRWDVKVEIPGKIDAKLFAFKAN